MYIWYPPPFYNFIEKDFRSHAASAGSYSHALCFWGCNGLIQTLRIKEFQTFYARLCHRLNTWAKFLAGGHELSISNLAEDPKLHNLLLEKSMESCNSGCLNSSHSFAILQGCRLTERWGWAVSHHLWALYAFSHLQVIWQKVFQQALPCMCDSLGLFPCKSCCRFVNVALTDRQSLFCDWYKSSVHVEALADVADQSLNIYHQALWEKEVKPGLLGAGETKTTWSWMLLVANLYARLQLPSSN